MQDNLVYNENNIFIENRAKIRITGVVDVDTFDDYNISIKTEDGFMVVGGEELKIIKLDVESGELLIEGKFNSLFYNETIKNDGSLLAKLFK